MMKWLASFILMTALTLQVTYALPLQKQKVDVLVNALRDVYNHIDAAIGSVETKVNNLQTNQLSLSTKVGSLQSSLSALTTRVNTGGRAVCSNKLTAWQPRSDASIMYLDRHLLSCPSGQFLASFRLTRKADLPHAEVRYSYKCCKMVF